jgi:hypothetical protein
VEYTKAQGIILFKELGKIAPYVSKKEFLYENKEEIKSGGELFTKNTIFSKHVSGSIRNDSCPITVS